MWAATRQNLFLVLIWLVLGVFIGIIGTLISIYTPRGWVNLLFAWQTVTAGALAILAAGIGAFAARIATREQIFFNQMKEVRDSVVELRDFAATTHAYCMYLRRIEEFYFGHLPDRLPQSHIHSEKLARHGMPAAAAAFEDLQNAVEYIRNNEKKLRAKDNKLFDKTQNFAENIWKWCFDVLRHRRTSDFSLGMFGKTPMTAEMFSALLYQRYIEEHEKNLEADAKAAEPVKSAE